MDETIARIKGYWLLVADCDKDTNHWAARYKEDVLPLLQFITDQQTAILDMAKHIAKLSIQLGKPPSEQ